MLKNIPTAVICALISLPHYGFAASTFTEQQKQEIGTVVHEYLMQNPEVIKDAIMALQQKQVQSMNQNAKKVAITEKEQLFSAKSPSSGAAAPKEMMVMFFDYQCGHCKNVSTTVEELLVENKDLKIIYKEFPIFGPNSVLASKVALAAQKQGKYKELHQKLMAAKTAFDESKLMKLAKEVGLDEQKLKQDMASAEVDAEIKANIALAQKLGLRGTPAFIITRYPDISEQTITFIPGVASKAQFQEMMGKSKNN